METLLPRIASAVAALALAAAALSGSRNPDAAKALVDFLASPETIALLKSRGFDVKP